MLCLFLPRSGAPLAPPWKAVPCSHGDGKALSELRLREEPGNHAGWRKSGMDGADGKHGLDEYLQTHVVNMNCDLNEQ
jgi:hypothetical protein